MNNDNDTSKTPPKKGGGPPRSGKPRDDFPQDPPTGGEVGHTPIIITDEDVGGLQPQAESEQTALAPHVVSIEFDEDEYATLSGSTHSSNHLRLQRVENDDLQGNRHVCHELARDEECEIIVRCTRPNQPDLNFVIRGGRMFPPTKSPTITFSHTEFPQAASFTGRRKHSNNTRRITQLLILRVVNGVPQDNPVHDCPLITPGGQCLITVRDPHPEDDP